MLVDTHSRRRIRFVRARALWGPAHPFGLGAADWQISFRARRISGAAAAWNINASHSTSTLRVVGSERLGA